MARNIESADGEWVSYVPEYDGIREAYDNGEDMEPVVMELKAMSGRHYKEQIAASMSDRQRKKLGVKKAATEIIKTERKVFADCVRNVRNYTIAGGAIDTGAELFDRGERGIVVEIGEALESLSKIDEGHREISSSPSSSARAVSPPSSGIAGTVKPTGSVRAEGAMDRQQETLALSSHPN